MSILKKVFPQAMMAKDVVGLVIAILIYVIVGALGGWVFSLLAKIPLAGFVFGILGWAFGIYCTVGIVVAILVFFKVVK